MMPLLVHPLKALALGGMRLSDNAIAKYHSVALGGAGCAMMRGRHRLDLKYLDLSANEISCEGAQALGRYLETDPCLEHLNLEDNRIGAEGMRALAQGLALKNGHLRELKVGGNLLGDACMGWVGEMMARNTTLESLAIDGIGVSALCCAEHLQQRVEALVGGEAASVTDRGIETIARVINAGHLKVLRLGGPLVSSEGAVGMIAEITTNPRLEKLQIVGTLVRMDQAKARHLAERLRRNGSLQEIMIQGGVPKALKEVLNRNIQNARLRQVTLYELLEKESLNSF